MQAKDFQFLADSLVAVALAAARVQMAYFAAGVVVQTKADKSPVTVADQESEAVILEGLARAAPGVAVVSEEAAAAGHVGDLLRLTLRRLGQDGARTGSARRTAGVK